jgi:acylphosphatase
MSGMKVRVHAVVSGDVQGVFFRANTRDRAHQLHINGWVRNRPDGRVEAVFEGDREDVEQMLEFCRAGPSGARVERVDVQWQEHKNEFSTFEIIY